MPDLMKGHKWRDHAAKMVFPAWAEIKTDEIRCHVIVHPLGPQEQWGVEFVSYAGKGLLNLRDYATGFRELAAATGLFEFDTGFLVGDSFDDSYRWVRSKRLPEDLKGKPVTFLLFDLPTEAGPFSMRVVTRHNVYVQAVALEVPLVLPAGTWVHNEEEVGDLFLKAHAAGHEGLMVKSMAHLYERGKRTYGWLKVKPEDDADGIITAIHEAISEDGKPLGRAGSVTIKVEDGSEATPHGIAHNLGREMFENPDKFLGQWAEFKFMMRDRQGGYRHPVWSRLREAKA